MSLAVKELNVQAAFEPRTKVNEQRSFTIIRGGLISSWKPVSSTSYNSSVINFTAPPPSVESLIDRKVLFNLPMQVNFSGIFASGTGPTGTAFLQLGEYDAPRAFPISENLINTQVTINNTAVNVITNDTFNALMRYDTPTDERQFDYSMTPSMLDQWQNYSDGNGWNRNPLNPYGDITSEMGRGGFPLELVSNTVLTNGATGGSTGLAGSAQVNMQPTENIFLSPFMFGHHQASAFIGVQTMEFVFNLDPNIQRVWSHAGGNPFISVFNTPSVSIGQSIGIPTLYFNYITHAQLMQVPKAVCYPYYEVQRYITSQPSADAAGASNQIVSNQIILKSIPNRVYVYVRRRNADRTCFTSDTFAEITNLNVTFNNSSGLMTSAQPPDLYRLSVDNGCQISWPQWHLNKKSSAGTSLQYAYGNVASGLNGGYVGSVICLDFAKDICVGDLECPGIAGQYSLQININYTNPNLTNSVQYDAYIVPILEGSFTLTGNSSVTQIGIVSKSDIEKAQQNPMVDYEAARGIYGGGSFFGDLLSKVKSVLPSLPQAAKSAAKIGCKFLGDGVTGGNMYVEGGTPTGGKRRKNKNKNKEMELEGGKAMSRKMLAQRLGL